MSSKKAASGAVALAKWVVVLTSLVFVGVAAPDGEATGRKAQFAGMGFLVGHCWQGEMPNDQGLDTHCFMDVYDGAVIRDQHIVCGKGEPYAGETIYTWDSGIKRIVFRYFNSLGGLSDGSLTVDGDTIRFPVEEHHSNDGRNSTFRTTWQRHSGDSYESVMDAKTDDGWSRVWHVVYTKVTDIADSNVVSRGDNGQLICTQD